MSNTLAVASSTDSVLNGTTADVVAGRQFLWPLMKHAHESIFYLAFAFEGSHDLSASLSLYPTSIHFRFYNPSICLSADNAYVGFAANGTNSDRGKTLESCPFGWGCADFNISGPCLRVSSINGNGVPQSNLDAFPCKSGHVVAFSEATLS